SFLTMSTILLADDEDSLRALVRATLGGDHRLIEARDGREALEAARRDRPDLVLLDRLMPAVRGFEVRRPPTDEPAPPRMRVHKHAAGAVRRHAVRGAAAARHAAGRGGDPSAASVHAPPRPGVPRRIR